MRIMRMDSEGEGLAPPPWMFRSNSRTRASSLWIWSFNSSTLSSVIGAIAEELEGKDLTKVERVRESVEGGVTVSRRRRREVKRRERKGLRENRRGEKSWIANC